jgi:hypothetical protein
VTSTEQIAKGPYRYIRGCKIDALGRYDRSSERPHGLMIGDEPLLSGGRAIIEQDPAK